MQNILAFDSRTSIRDSLQPFLKKHLNDEGWVLIKVNPSEKIMGDMLIIATLVGEFLFCKSIAYHMLDNNDSKEPLAVHTEGISHASGIVPYFALGCINSPISGGETRIFDGRKAAKMIDEVPELEGVEIEYFALANPDSRIRHPLIVSDYGRTVRYRSRVESNLVINSGTFSEKEMYECVDDIILKSLLVSHTLEVGDLLFVNNLFTLHDRLPFSGNRQMLRIRYNDFQNTRVRY